jgi:hypothetical protein
MVLVFVVVLLVPVMAFAWPATMGVYFERVPGLMAYAPPPFVPFYVYIYLHSSDHYVTAVEYQLQTPLDPGHALFFYSNVCYPESYSVSLGNPFDGHSITYWPPLDGWNPGYNELCCLECYIAEPCWNDGGAMIEYLLVIGPHPDSGNLSGIYWPDYMPFPIIGLTSVLCPEEPVPVEEESWGAIKAMVAD